MRIEPIASHPDPEGARHHHPVLTELLKRITQGGIDPPTGKGPPANLAARCLERFGVCPQNVQHRFPLRGLKLDVSLQNDPDMLTSLSSIAKCTGLALIAPGVEDATRLQSLQQHGCTYAQGNALALTMDEEALIGYLDQMREGDA